MPRIDTNRLISQATDVAIRANFVRKEPAVVKAWKEAGADVLQASRSTSKAAMETQSAWRRAGYSQH